MPPSTEAIRRAVEALLCPWCGKGPFKLLARHTNHAHGIDRNELRDRAGLTYSASISSPDLHAQRSEHAQNLRAAGVFNGGPTPLGAKRNLSEAAQALNRAKLEASRDPEQALAALAIAGPRAAQAKKQAARERDEAEPHGTYRKYTTYGCRCVECRAANTDYYRIYRAERRTGNQP
ncbi:hypothetical protein PD653_2146 [Nocardioides sp. PD653]|nr:hypothetical protein PD653_2146 [Nocardioides sp. PD653]